MKPFDSTSQSTVAKLVAQYVPFQQSSKYDEVAIEEAESLTGPDDEKFSYDTLQRPSQISIRFFIAAQCATVATFVLLVMIANFIPNPSHAGAIRYSDPAQIARNVRTEYTYLQDPISSSLDVTSNEYFYNQTSPPGGDGMVYLNYNGSDEAVSWGVTMFHALHCLRHIRYVIQGSEQNFASDTKQMHTGHCFDYVAQVLLCGGDSTIEKPVRRDSPDGTRHVYTINGVGATHQCKDTSLMFEAAKSSKNQPLHLGEWEWQPGDTLETVLNVAGMLSEDGKLEMQI